MKFCKIFRHIKLLLDGNT